MENYILPDEKKCNEILEKLSLGGGLEITGKPRKVAAFFEALYETEKMVEKIRDIQRTVSEVYGECPGFFDIVVEHLFEHEKVPLEGNVLRSRLLTNEDVVKWEAWKKADQEGRLQVIEG